MSAFDRFGAAKSLEIKKPYWVALKPLITLKTDEKMFGKVWKIQAKSLDIFGKSLEKAWKPGGCFT